MLLPPRYRHECLLGEGNYGEVHRAFDLELRRSVAFKIPKDVTGDPEAIARFREEAQILAQLEHPGILPAYDVGYLPDGRLWYTMREIKGDTLEGSIFI